MIAATARNSWTKSRSLTASIEFANARRMPSRSAVAAGSSPSVEVAVAPAPNADVGRTIRPLREPLEVAGARPRVREQVVAERHGLGETRVGRTGHHGRLVLARARDQRGHQRADRARRSAAPASSSHSRRSVTTRSLRDRPAWSLAPRSPRRSVTSRSIDRVDVFVGGIEREPRPLRCSSPTSASAASSVSASSAVEQPGGQQRPDMRDARRERPPAASRSSKCSERPRACASGAGGVENRPAHSGAVRRLTRRAPLASPTTP